MKGLIFLVLAIFASDYFTNLVQTAQIIEHNVLGNEPELSPSENTFNSIVSIRADGHHVCAGGIIGERFIVSAAHCFIDMRSGRFKTDNFTIVTTLLNFFESSEFSVEDEIYKVYVPKNFNPVNLYERSSHQLDGDIAIVKLRNGLNFYENPRLSKLKLVQENLAVNETYRVAAQKYIVVSFTKQGTSGVSYCEGKIKYANVKLLPYKICKEFYSSFNPESQFCAQVKNEIVGREGTCTGESGSPVIYGSDLLVGIVSDTIVECNDFRRPAIYINISYYATFIENAINNRKTFQMRTAKWRRPLFQLLESCI